MHEITNLRSTIARCGHHTSQRSLNASGVVCSCVIACTKPEAGFGIYVCEIAMCFRPIRGSALMWPCACSILFKHCKALTVCASGDAKHSCVPCHPSNCIRQEVRNQLWILSSAALQYAKLKLSCLHRSRQQTRTGLQQVHTWPDIQICAAACSCLGAQFHVLAGTGCLPSCLQSLLVGVTS